MKNLKTLIPLATASVLMGACSLNSQSLNKSGVKLDGGAAAMNSVSTSGEDYRASSNVPMGLIDGQGFSMAAANPMTVMTLDLADGQKLNLGSGGNGTVESVEVENLVTGYKTTVTGFNWGAKDEIVAHAQVATLLYESMKDLSLDEKEARIKAIEEAGKVAQAVIPLLRAMAGVP